MPKYRITGPDGKQYDITAPDGASQDDVLSYVRTQVNGQGSGSKLQGLLDKIDNQQKNTQSEYDPTGSGASYIGQQVKQGAAMALGAPVEAINSALNLGRAGYGVLKHELTGSNDLPQLETNPVGGVGTFQRLFQFNPNVKPTGPINAVAGRTVRDLTAAAPAVIGMAGSPALMLGRAATPAAITAAQAQSPVPALLAGEGIAALASGAGQTARAVAPEPYKDVADLAGQAVGGIAVPGFLGTRLGAVQALANLNKPSTVNRYADNYVRGQLADAARNFPGAGQNLAEAAVLEQQIPGLQYRIGQATGIPSVTDLERRVATSSPERFNERTIQDRAQGQAIEDQAKKDLPLLAGDGLLSDLEKVQTARADLAQKLPTTAPEETGQTLRDARASIKGKYDQLAAQKYADPIAEAESLGVTIDPSNIITKAKEVLSNPLLKFDAANAPAIAGRIAALEKPAGPAILGPNGQPISSRGSAAEPISFETYTGLRQAVNQDIARERGSQAPEARQRLRALVGLRQEIDAAAEQAPQSVKNLYDEANRFYRDEYAPKFLRGTNLKQSLRDVTGEQKIPDERLAGQYFKPGGATPMSRFLSLYGDNKPAMTAMENHILDTYRKTVVRDGVIDPAKHAAFVSNYAAPLRQIPGLRTQIDSMGAASAALGERENMLADAQRLLEQGQLDRMRYDSPDKPGLDPKKLNAFLSKNGQDFSDAVAKVYGDKVAQQHMQNLERITRAAEIAERGRIPENASPSQTTSPLDMQKTIGFTGRTVFNMIRAVTTGRTSAEDMAYTLGAQAGAHRIRLALIKAEERAVSDPETAKLIAQAINTPATTQEGKNIAMKIIAKGGAYLVGTPKYEAVGKYAIPQFAVQASNMARQPDQGSQPIPPRMLGVRPRPILSPEPASEPLPAGILNARRG